MFKYTFMEVPPFIFKVWKQAVINYTNNYTTNIAYISKEPWTKMNEACSVLINGVIC